jgi:hypothetical protein
MKTILNLAALIACFFLNAASAAQALSLPRDGWISWTITAVDSAPNWCCLEWHGKSPKATTCELDGKEHGYSSNGRNDTNTDMRIYARFNAGKLERLRTFAASCPVKTNTPITSLDNITAEDSVTWLASLVNTQASSNAPTGSTKTEKRLSSDAMASLAVHRGNAARDALTTIARKNSIVENRKDALFWLAQVRGQEGAEIVAPSMFDDADAKVREHAGFAMSQSQSSIAAPSLIRQGTSDQSAKVRAQAWFWLSQIKSPEAEASINRAIHNDPDAGVRTQAVFALSQLPSERAIAALISVAEDKSVTREDRKQAIFWMGQSKSDAALKYLDRVLSAKAEN